LTVFQSKGLEFNDVLLYNFFTDSLAQKEWRVVSQYLRDMGNQPTEEGTQHPLLDAGRIKKSVKPRPLEFDESKHMILLSELKYLYTALTRARINIWIYDEDKEVREPMFDFFRRRRLVSSVQGSILDETSIGPTRGLAACSTQEEWRDRGKNMMDHNLFAVAEKCFKKSGDDQLRDRARAFYLATEGTKILPKSNPRRYEHFVQAADLFLGIQSLAEAARCLAEAHLYSEAVTVFLQLRDAEKAVRMACRAKDYSIAKDLFLHLGKKRSALLCYCKMKDHTRYVDLFDELFQDKNVQRTAAKAERAFYEESLSILANNFYQNNDPENSALMYTKLPYEKQQQLVYKKVWPDEQKLGFIDGFVSASRLGEAILLCCNLKCFSKAEEILKRMTKTADIHIAVQCFCYVAHVQSGMELLPGQLSQFISEIMNNLHRNLIALFLAAIREKTSEAALNVESQIQALKDHGIPWNIHTPFTIARAWRLTEVNLKNLQKWIKENNNNVIEVAEQKFPYAIHFLRFLGIISTNITLLPCHHLLQAIVSRQPSSVLHPSTYIKKALLIASKLRQNWSYQVLSNKNSEEVFVLLDFTKIILEWTKKEDQYEQERKLAFQIYEALFPAYSTAFDWQYRQLFIQTTRTSDFLWTTLFSYVKKGEHVVYELWKSLCLFQKGNSALLKHLCDVSCEGLKKEISLLAQIKWGTVNTCGKFLKQRQVLLDFGYAILQENTCSDGQAEQAYSSFDDERVQSFSVKNISKWLEVAEHVAFTTLPFCHPKATKISTSNRIYFSYILPLEQSLRSCWKKRKILPEIMESAQQTMNTCLKYFGYILRELRKNLEYFGTLKQEQESSHACKGEEHEETKKDTLETNDKQVDEWIKASQMQLIHLLECVSLISLNNSKLNLLSPKLMMSLLHPLNQTVRNYLPQYSALVDSLYESEGISHKLITLLSDVNDNLVLFFSYNGIKARPLGERKQQPVEQKTFNERKGNIFQRNEAPVNPLTVPSHPQPTLKYRPIQGHWDGSVVIKQGQSRTNTRETTGLQEADSTRQQQDDLKEQIQEGALNEQAPLTSNYQPPLQETTQARSDQFLIAKSQLPQESQVQAQDNDTPYELGTTPTQPQPSTMAYTHPPTPTQQQPTIASTPPPTPTHQIQQESTNASSQIQHNACTLKGISDNRKAEYPQPQKQALNPAAVSFHPNQSPIAPLSNYPYNVSNYYQPHPINPYGNFQGNIYSPPGYLQQNFIQYPYQPHQFAFSMQPLYNPEHFPYPNYQPYFPQYSNSNFNFIQATQPLYPPGMPMPQPVDEENPTQYVSKLDISSLEGEELKNTLGSLFTQHQSKDLISPQQPTPEFLFCSYCGETVPSDAIDRKEFQTLHTNCQECFIVFSDYFKDIVCVELVKADVLLSSNDAQHDLVEVIVEQKNKLDLFLRKCNWNQNKLEAICLKLSQANLELFSALGLTRKLEDIKQLLEEIKFQVDSQKHQELSIMTPEEEPEIAVTKTLAPPQQQERKQSEELEDFQDFFEEEEEFGWKTVSKKPNKRKNRK